jgi:hypothetical protein
LGVGHKANGGEKAKGYGGKEGKDAGNEHNSL